MRVRIFRATILFFFACLVLGLFYNQIWKYDLYRERSENNRIRVLPLEAPRGKIYDRKKRPLVTNRISFDVEVIFQEIKDKEKVARLLSGALGIDEGLLTEKIETAREIPYAPVKIAEDIQKNKAIRIEEFKLDLPGVIVTTRPMRDYLYGEALSHVTGYLGRISEKELERFKPYGYRMKDFVGKDGIERFYNDYLRGVDGGLQVEVDNRGRQLGLLAIKEPRPGRDLYLSIDIELQKFCDTILGDKRGAIVAMSPLTGEIFALVSHPGFDPGVFVKPGNLKEVSALFSNSMDFPMMDRAISGTYAPGSVFKIVVAASALDTGKFNDKKTLSCNGVLPVGNRLFHCWKEKGHGILIISEAMKYSCNVFFYQLGLLSGADTIAKYAFKLGLGEPTGVDLPGEAGGFVPTPSWKRKTLGVPWFRGETANYAIGQGYLLVTPIQIVRLVGAIANGGKLVHPFVASRIEEIDLRHAKPHDTGLKKKTLEILKECLRGVVNEPHGTGLYARSKDIVIAGKTGTAQNPQGTSHAWFAGFAPFEDPRFCVVVFIEHGGKGGLNPARFAKRIIEEAKRLKLCN